MIYANIRVNGGGFLTPRALSMASSCLNSVMSLVAIR